MVLTVILLAGSTASALPLVVKANLLSLSAAPTLSERTRSASVITWLSADLLDFAIGTRVVSNWGLGIGVVHGEYLPELLVNETGGIPPIVGPHFRAYLLRAPPSPEYSLIPVGFAYASWCPANEGANVKFGIGAGWTFAVVNPEVEFFWQHVYPFTLWSGLVEPASDHVGLALRVGLGGWYGVRVAEKHR